MFMMAIVMVAVAGRNRIPQPDGAGRRRRALARARDERHGTREASFVCKQTKLSPRPAPRSPTALGGADAPFHVLVTNYKLVISGAPDSY